MAVRTIVRRGERRIIIDIRYRLSDGSKGRYRHDAEVQTLAAARAEERRRLAALVTTGSPFDAPTAVAAEVAAPGAPALTAVGPSFHQIVQEYLATFAPSRLKPSTVFSYSVIIKTELLPRLADLPVQAIDAVCVREIDVALVRRGVKSSTRRNVQTVLRSILCRYGVEAGYFDAPPRLPRLPKVGAKVVTSMSDEDLNRLLAASKPAVRLALMLSAYAGLRGGEIRGLRRLDVDLTAGQIVVRHSICRGAKSTPKSGHERIVPLAVPLRPVLEMVRDLPREAPVSLSTIGRPWSESALDQAFRRTAKRAGLAGFRLHDLRHYFVTTLFRRGAPAPAIQALAGHSSLAVTQRYAHVGAVDLRDAMAKLGGSAPGRRRVRSSQGRRCGPSPADRVASKANVPARRARPRSGSSRKPRGAAEPSTRRAKPADSR